MKVAKYIMLSTLLVAGVVHAASNRECDVEGEFAATWASLNDAIQDTCVAIESSVDGIASVCDILQDIEENAGASSTAACPVIKINQTGATITLDVQSAT